MRLSVLQPCLCLVTDRKVGDEAALVDRVAEAVAGGVDMVQLREKDLHGGLLLELAASLKRRIGDRALFIVNERADVAMAAGADGVQLGEQALPVAAVRSLVGPEALIGRSVHSEDGAEEAAADGADFLVVGTMYATRSHPGIVPAGPALLRRIARRCRLPLIGIGGISPDNVGEVLRAGALGVAVITSVLGASHPGEEARRLKQAMLDAWMDLDPSPSGSGLLNSDARRGLGAR
jgi:thiamine-phosphate diphosphorylase